MAKVKLVLLSVLLSELLSVALNQVAAGPGQESAAAGSVKAEMMTYWRETLVGSAMPEPLQRLVSPLSISQAQRFQHMIEEGHLANNPTQANAFCASSNLLCRDLDKFHRTTSEDCNIQNNGVKNLPPVSPQTVTAEQHVWFLETDLSDPAYRVPASVQEFSLPGGAGSRPAAAFLPRRLVQALGAPTVSNVPNLLAQLHIPHNSAMAELMHAAAATCDSNGNNRLEGELARCVTSMEDLADLLHSQFAQSDGQVELLPLSPVPGSATRGSPSLRVSKAELRAGAGRPYLIAHPAGLFPYNFVLGHHVPQTKVYAVTLASDEYSISNVALCHMDTREWSPNHVAFQLLATEPGGAGVCHWTHAAALVFV